jgi:hypothetical protein
MRASHCLRLLVIGTVILGLWTERSAAQHPGRSRSRTSATPHLKQAWEATAEGRADDKEVAERIALNKAQEKLEKFLHTQPMPVVRWVPSVEYIEAHLLQGQPNTIQLAASEDQAGEGKFLVKVNIAVSDSDYQKLLEYDRQQSEQHHQALVQGRLLGLGKVLIGLVVLLGAMAGYCRLEEATKGYYTTWLRAAVIGLIVVVGLGLLVVG